MTKWLAALILIMTASCFPAFAAKVRAASETELSGLLIGCWTREITPSEIVEKREQGIHSDSYLCFSSGGKVEMSTVGGSEKYGLEGFGSEGTFEVKHGKLVLDAERPSDGWIIGDEHAECDVIMSLNRTMKLLNCIGSQAGSLEKLPDTSYAWRVPVAYD